MPISVCKMQLEFDELAAEAKGLIKNCPHKHEEIRDILKNMAEINDLPGGLESVLNRVTVDQLNAEAFEAIGHRNSAIMWYGMAVAHLRIDDRYEEVRASLNERLKDLRTRFEFTSI